MDQEPTKKTFRHYLYFLSGQQFSLLGSVIVYFVITWWITVETGSVIYLSIMSFLFFIPQIVITPLAGVLSDKLNRKKVIFVADGLQAFVTFLLFLVFFLRILNVWLIISINTLRSVLQAFHYPTVSAIIPSMIPKDKLSRINGMNFLVSGVMQIIGPAVAATLMEVFPITNIILVDIFTFFIALIPLILIKIPSVTPSSPHKLKKSFLKDFKEGFRVAIVVPGLLSLMIWCMFINFFSRPYMVLMPYYIKFVHFGDPLSYALVMIFMQVGNFSGALLTLLKKNWKHKITVLFGTIMIFFIGYGVITFAPIGSFIFIGICMAVSFFTLPINVSVYLTILQTKVPKDKIGRITSIDHMISVAVTPIGSILSGPLAELIGINLLFMICTFLGIIWTIIIWLFTKVRQLDSIDQEMMLIEDVTKIKEEMIIE